MANFFKMPVTKSAQKALKKDRRRMVVNQLIRRQFKAALKKARLDPNLKNLSQAAKILDRAAKKRVIHPNKAARLKSRLAKLSQKKKTVKKNPKKAAKTN